MIYTIYTPLASKTQSATTLSCLFTPAGVLLGSVAQ